MGASLFTLFFNQGVARGFWTIVIAHTLFCLSFVAMTVKARIRGTDWTLEDAAMDLGSSPMRTFWKITMPIITPGVVGRVPAVAGPEHRRLHHHVVRRRPDDHVPPADLRLGPHRPAAAGPRAGDDHHARGDRHHRRRPPSPATAAAAAGRRSIASRRHMSRPEAPRIALAPEGAPAWMAEADHARAAATSSPLGRGRGDRVGRPPQPRGAGRGARRRARAPAGCSCRSPASRTSSTSSTTTAQWTCGKGVYAEPVAEMALTLGPRRAARLRHVRPGPRLDARRRAATCSGPG